MEREYITHNTKEDLVLPDHYHRINCWGSCGAIIFVDSIRFKKEHGTDVKTLAWRCKDCRIKRVVEEL